MTKRWIGVAALIAILGVTAWFAFGRSKPKPAARPTMTAVTAEQPAPAPRPREASDRGGPPPILARDADPAGPLLLEGAVLDEHDQPVAGAEVWISSAPRRTATTDTDGSFSFDKLLGREYAIGARAGDRIGGPLTTKVTAGGEPVVIRLRAGAQLVVTVRAADGDQPIAGATVTLLEGGEPTETTDGDGHATFRGVGDGYTSVTAVAPGYGPANGSVMIGKTQRLAEVAVWLSPGAAVSGVVVDERGAPIKDAKVTASDVSLGWDPARGRGQAPITTDGKGAFTIPALAAGSYRVNAADETHAPAASEPFTVDGVNPTTGIKVVMPAGAHLAGVVVDSAGQPAAYATVKLSGSEAAADTVYRQAAADERGQFSIDALPRREVKVRAESETAASAVASVDLAAVPEKKDLRLLLDQEGAISGVVVDGAGEPVAEASVSAVVDFLADDRKRGDFTLASSTATTTDGGGRFTLRGLEDGSYRLAASREGHGERAAFGADSVSAKTGATDVRLVLPAPGGVRGTITMNGKAPPLAVVSAGWEHRVTTRDGSFELGGMNPGKYDLRITGPDFAEVARGDVAVADGKVTDVGAIAVTAGRKATGRVVDSKGAPVAGAKVLVGKMIFGDGKSNGGSDFEGDGQQGLRSATTTADGEFAVRGISREGGIAVAEHASAGRSVSIDVPPGTDDVTGLRIVLRGYGSLTGTVTRKGKPVAGATVSAAPIGSSGQAVFVTAGPDGKFVLDKVPEGPTAVQAMKQQMMSTFNASRQVQVVAGRAADASIDIPAGEIALTVKVQPKPNETVNAAWLLLVRGGFAAANGKALMDAFLAVQGASGGGAAGAEIWLGGATFPTFRELVAGSYTVCALPITGNIMDSQLNQRINANLDKLDVVCKGVEVKPSPVEQDFTLVTPAMKPLPAPGDDAGAPAPAPK